MRTAIDWSIQDVVRMTGTTSRTLRHYDAVGLVAPSRIGDNGYRYYDAAALVRLQRVLMLRELGLGIPAIAEVLAGQRDDVAALRTHLDRLSREQERLGRQRASVERTIARLEEGEVPMVETMFDGFDHTRYQDEVERRWGADSYATSDAWYGSLSQEEQDDFLIAAAELGAAWAAAAGTGAPADGDEAQALAQRHADWLRTVPGTPRAADGRVTREYFAWMADAYVTDESLGRDFCGVAAAPFVRDAMRRYAERALEGLRPLRS